MVTDIDAFNEQVERFLKKQMSPEEQERFLSELKKNPELLQRAQTIALTIREMDNIRRKQGKDVIDAIEGIDEKQFLEEIQKSPKMEAFDERVTKFLKKQMTKDEESDFLIELEAIPLLKERAQTIALAIQQMQAIRKEEGDRIIESIKKMDEKEIPHTMGEYEHQGKVMGRRVWQASNQPHVVSQWYKIRKYVAAACIVGLLSFGGYRYYQYYEITTLGETYDGAVQMESITRGGTQDNMPELKSLLKHVANGENLSETALRLDGLYKESIGEEYSEYSNYANIIGWNAAIAYLKDGNRKDALRILQSIKRQNEGKEIAEKAEELIEQIEAI